MGKSKKIKKWGGANDPNDPNASDVPPGTYDAANIGVNPNAPGSTSTTTTVNKDADANAKRGFFSDAVDSLSDKINSLNPFASTSVDDLKKKREDKSTECDAALKAIDAEIAAATGLPVTKQQGGRRRKRSHKKRSHKKRSRRSKRSRRHR